MWGKFEDEVADIQRHHASVRYLPDLRLPDSLTATTDPAEALAGAGIGVLAVPATAVPDSVTGLMDAITVMVSIIVAQLTGVFLSHSW